MEERWGKDAPSLETEGEGRKEGVNEGRKEGGKEGRKEGGREGRKEVECTKE